MHGNFLMIREDYGHGVHHRQRRCLRAKRATHVVIIGLRDPDAEELIEVNDLAGHFYCYLPADKIATGWPTVLPPLDEIPAGYEPCWRYLNGSEQNKVRDSNLVETEITLDHKDHTSRITFDLETGVPSLPVRDAGKISWYGSDESDIWIVDAEGACWIDSEYTTAADLLERYPQLRERMVNAGIAKAGPSATQQSIMAAHVDALFAGTKYLLWNGDAAEAADELVRDGVLQKHTKPDSHCLVDKVADAARKCAVQAAADHLVQVSLRARNPR